MEQDLKQSEERLRFGFGENWSEYVAKNLDAERVEAARAHLLAFLQLDDLTGKTFLDVGCGSGIHSLAALRSGASRVVGFDYDPDSVRTSQLVHRWAGASGEWSVEQGDVLDRAYVESLPKADVVYAWGVLHHTGKMWRAIETASSRMRDDGVFYLALYTADVYHFPTAEHWLGVKRLYNRSGPLGKRLLEAAYVACFSLPSELWSWRYPLQRLRRRRSRGMSFYTDVKDWLGGWPMEFARIAEVKDFARDELGLELLHMWAGEANTEYLFRRRGAANYWDEVRAAHPARDLAGPFARGAGASWIAELDRGEDSPPDRARSTLMLYEDEVPLGFAHASPGKIRRFAGGRFNHLGRSLLFSTPDGTDPNTNGRRYSIRFGLAPP